jgi:hypothetical protein
MNTLNIAPGHSAGGSIPARSAILAGMSRRRRGPTI